MMMKPEEVAARLRAGECLYLAGDEKLLAQLPQGNWIGGTIPYFMDEAGGRFSRELIFVQQQMPQVSGVSIRSYGVDQLSQIVADSPEHGFTVLIIPGMSQAHLRYGQHAPEFPGLFMKQIIGWIAGIDLADLGKAAPKVFNGATGEVLGEGAVALHATLPEDKFACIGILNLFKQGDGDALRFEDEGFTVGACTVNGAPDNFAQYLTRNKIDTRLPLVANYHGEMINVSVKSIDAASGKVELYAPVFRSVEYRFAQPVADYEQAFARQIPEGLVNPEFSCNCILNYLYSQLEGKKTGTLTGPVTFGEIAYQLLNQTLVYLKIYDA